MLGASERRQAPDDVREVVETCAGIVIEVPPDPPSRSSSVTPGVLMRDQCDELERLVESDLSGLACSRFRAEQVPALDRSMEYGPRMSLCSRTCLPGAGASRA